MNSKRPLPYLALIAGICALSMTGIFVRWAQAPGTVTAAYRMGISALALLPFFVRKEAAHPSAGHGWWSLVLLSGLFVAGDHGFLNTAVGLTRIANTTLLNNMAPLWVALFALLVWHEKLNRTFWLGLLAALIGAVIILGSDLLQHPQFGLGDVLAWISSLFYAAYFLVTQRTRQRVSTLRYLFMVNIISAVLLFAYNFATGIPVSGYPLRTYLVFLAIGLFSHTIGYFCITYALGHLPASLVAPTMIAQLVLTSLLAIPLAGETLSLLQMVGGAAVLAGIYLVNRSDRASAQSESAAAETPQAGF